MRTKKNRLVFYTTIAMLVIGTSLIGGWLINSAMNSTQYTGIKEPERSPQQHWLDEHFNRAISYMQKKQYPQAVLIWNDILLVNDTIAEVHVNQGFSLYEMGHIQPASKHFQRAIDLNNFQVNAYYGLAICYEKLEEMEAAMGAMRSFIHLADDNDPFIRKARAALWEWESRADTVKTEVDPETKETQAAATK